MQLSTAEILRKELIARVRKQEIVRESILIVDEIPYLIRWVDQIFPSTTEEFEERLKRFHARKTN